MYFLRVLGSHIFRIMKTNYVSFILDRTSVIIPSRIGSLNSFALELIEEDVVRYTFLWGAPIGDLKSTKQKIQEVCDIYAGIFGYRPEFFLYTFDYRMQFKFIITTHSSETLIRNIREFRNEIVSRFH